MNSTKTSFAYTLQGGLDFFVHEAVSLGFAGAWYKFASVTYDASPSARVFIPAFLGISGALSSFTLTGNAAYHF